jgi:hypothetical protein
MKNEPVEAVPVEPYASAPGPDQRALSVTFPAVCVANDTVAPEPTLLAVPLTVRVPDDWLWRIWVL